MSKCVVKYETTRAMPFRHRSDLYLLNLEVVKAYFKNGPNKYYNEDTPVGVSITIYHRKPKKVRTTRPDEPSVNDIDFGRFTGAFLRTLENIAYDKARQVGEFYIERFYDQNPRIEFEVYEL
jgi:Holliday junction resolvase RusA-like endonuclease